MSPERTALLVMDVQEGIVERFDSQAVVERVVAAIAAARPAGVRVIYVMVGFRPGYPEASPYNKTFSAIRGSGRMVEGESVAVYGAVAPRSGDTVSLRGDGLVIVPSVFCWQPEYSWMLAGGP